MCEMLCQRLMSTYLATLSRFDCTQAATPPWKGFTGWSDVSYKNIHLLPVVREKKKTQCYWSCLFLLDQMAHDIWIHLDPLQTAEDLKFCWMGWRKQVAFPHNVPKIILHVQTHLCWFHVIRYMCYMLNMWPVSMLLSHLSLKLVLVWLLKIVR